MHRKTVIGIGIVATMMVVTVTAAYVGYRSYRPFRNPSASMWPLLPVGATFNVNTFERVPQRGNAIVFRYPPHPEQDFTKRVIGLPGDRIEERGKGELVINGWPVPRCPVGNATLAGNEGPRSGALFVEHLGAASYVVFLTDDAVGTPTGPWTVAPGSFFVVGDNRSNSHDSRMFGDVPAGNLVGRVRSEADPSRLPAVAASASAIRACMAKRPAQTDPPPAK